MKNISKTKTAQTLFFINAAIWLVFGFYTLFRMANRYPGHIMVYIVGVLMLGNVTAMALCGFLLGKKNKWFFFLALFVLAANILLTFTDQFGFFDLATLVLDLVLFAILISIRKQYLSAS
jgi:hypothetical protein